MESALDAGATLALALATEGSDGVKAMPTLEKLEQPWAFAPGQVYYVYDPLAPLPLIWTAWRVRESDNA